MRVAPAIVPIIELLDATMLQCHKNRKQTRLLESAERLNQELYQVSVRSYRQRKMINTHDTSSSECSSNSHSNRMSNDIASKCKGGMSKVKFHSLAVTDKMTSTPEYTLYVNHRKKKIQEATDAGMKLVALMDYKLASAHFKDALAIQKEIYGDADLKVAETCVQLGTLAGKRHDWGDCQDYWAEAAEIYGRLLGYDNMKYLRAVEREDRAATKAYRTRKYDGSRLSDEVRKYMKLVQINIDAHMYEDAEKRLQKVLGLMKMKTGIDTIDVATMREIQGDICVYLGKYSEAQMIFTGVLRVLEEKVGVSDLQYMDVKRKLRSASLPRDKKLGYTA